MKVIMLLKLFLKLHTRLLRKKLLTSTVQKQYGEE